MKSMTFTKYIPDEAATLAFGAKLASACGDTAVIFLHGQLGAGKTTLARGFLRGLGYPGTVKSPTYTLVEEYEFENGWVFHFDFYRLNDPHELEYMGIQDYFIPQAICLIEWPESGSDMLPVADVSCYIEAEQNGRAIKLIAQSEHGNTILERLQDAES